MITESFTDFAKINTASYKLFSMANTLQLFKQQLLCSPCGLEGVLAISETSVREESELGD